MRIVAALAVAAAMASCAQARSGGSPDRSVKRTARTSSANPVLFNTESYDYAASAVTAAAAHRYRVIVLQATDGNKVAQLKAANPGAKILLYQLVSNSRSTDPQGATTCTPYAGDSTRHPGWFLTDQRGARIEDTTYAGSLPMDVGSSAYEHACVASAVARAKRYGFDGLYFDGFAAWIGWSLPPGVRSPRYPTMRSWQAAMRRMISLAAATAHRYGLSAIGNIGGSTATRGLWRAWSGPLDGAEEESWTDGGAGVIQQLHDWAVKLANVAWSEAHGKTVLLHSYNTTEAGNAYGLASMLLVAAGHSSYSTANASYSSPATFFPEYRTAEQLGGPLGAYRRLRNGAFMRAFTNGVVLVNPHRFSLQRFSLGGVFSGSRLSGVRSVSMGPASGLILLRR